MEKERHVKILSIVALVVAIVGMTLGFAAFSNTLTISSGATVNPSSDEFKIKIYGFKDQNLVADPESIWNYTDSDLSDSFGVSANFDATGSTVSIDNSNHTISNMRVNFGSTVGAVQYAFVIKNEGLYDAYLDLTGMIENESVNVLGKHSTATCTPGDGATPALVESACGGIQAIATFIDKETNDIKFTRDDYYKIPVGGSEVVYVVFNYEGPFADGPFEAEFTDFQFKFSTAQ